MRKLCENSTYAAKTFYVIRRKSGQLILLRKSSGATPTDEQCSLIGDCANGEERFFTSFRMTNKKASPVQGEVAERSEVGGVVFLFNCAAGTALFQY